ncbi:MAG: CHAD domain-containing protein [Acidimicrobiia bacterium]|nr:CHAD domain-containing protein [Acidimicrobiia bacterium]
MRDVIVGDLALVPDRPLGWSLQRAAIIQFDKAINAITDSEMAVPQGVHEARKATKRIRATLRLVRCEIGKELYRYENRAVRDAARLLSPLRTSHVAVESLDGLRDRFGSRLSDSAFDDLDVRLRHREQAIETDAVATGVVSDFVRAMRFGRARFASWSVSPDAESPYGGHIRDDFDALAPGLVRTYKRGRRGMERARKTPSVANLHEWRKRVKYLRHQTEVLAPLWPEVVGGLSVAVDHLGDLLGHDHDLADLVRLVTVRPELCPDALDRSLLSALAQQERTEVLAGAYVAGERIYAESPNAFAARLGSYWGSLMSARDPAL